MLQKRNFYINGTWVKSKNQKDIEVINPATEKSCAIISLGSKEYINDAVLAAKQAFNKAKKDKDLRRAVKDYIKNIKNYEKKCKM